MSSASTVLHDASPPPLPPDSVYTSCYCEENVYLLAQAFTKLSEANTTAGRVSWPWQIYAVFISNGGKTVALWSQKARDGVVVWDYHVVLVLLPRAPLNIDPKDGSGAALRGIPAQDPEQQAWVYDLDTTLPVPCPWRDYIAGTFPYAFDRSLADRIESTFHSLFRVIPGDVYLDHFASDRSHMIVEGVRAESESEAATKMASRDGSGGTEGPSPAVGNDIDEPSRRADEGPRYSQPPPPYPPLRGAKARALGIANNLMESFVAMDTKPAPLAEEFVGLREGEVRALGTSAPQYGQVMDMSGFVHWLAGSEKEA